MNHLSQKQTKILWLIDFAYYKCVYVCVWKKKKNDACFLKCSFCMTKNVVIRLHFTALGHEKACTVISLWPTNTRNVF